MKLYNTKIEIEVSTAAAETIQFIQSGGWLVIQNNRSERRKRTAKLLGKIYDAIDSIQPKTYTL